MNLEHMRKSEKRDGKSLKSSAKPFRSVFCRKKEQAQAFSHMSEREQGNFSNIKSHRLSTVEFCVQGREPRRWFGEWVKRVK